MNSTLSSSRSTRTWFYSICAVLVLVTVVTYSRVASCDFVTLDDPEYVTQKPFVSSGLSWHNLGLAFTETANNNNWHPLTFVSLMIDAQLFGLKNPGAFHLVNLFFHVANTLLLFGLLQRMTGAFWRSAFAAGLFALHPLRVESVAWVSERKDVLCVFFGLLAIWGYLRYLATGKKFVASGYYWFAVLFFIASLMSKAMLVTFPFVLLLLDFWPLERIKDRAAFVKLLIEKIPFFLVLPFAIGITAAMANKNMVGTEAWPLAGRFGNIFVAYAAYLGKLFWPANLSVEYTHPVYWPAGLVAGSAAVLLVITGVALWQIRRQPYVTMGWFWFLGTLVPVSGIVQVGNQGMADRFTYFPFIGLAILLSWGSYELCRKSGLRRELLVLTSGIVLLVCGWLSFQQTAYWKNSMTLYTHALQVTKDNSLVEYNMGIEYLVREQIPEAVKHWKEAVRIKPDHALAQNNLGNYAAMNGNLPEAVEHYRAAFKGDPRNETASMNLANNLIKLGQLDEAIPVFETAVKFDPKNAPAHFRLASILTVKKDFPGALLHLQKTVEIKPDSILALNGLAWMLATQPDSKLRNGAEATRLSLRAVSLTKTNDPGMLDTLAAAYAESGQFTNAVQTAELALQKANAAGKLDLIGDIETHLQSYREQKPVRE